MIVNKRTSVLEGEKETERKERIMRGQIIRYYVINIFCDNFRL